MEKSLKGIFVVQRAEKELLYLHKLTQLADPSGIAEEMGGEQLSFLDVLSSLHIEARCSSKSFPLKARMGGRIPVRGQNCFDTCYAISAGISGRNNRTKMARKCTGKFKSGDHL